MAAIPPVPASPTPAPAQGAPAATGEPVHAPVTSLPPTLTTTDRALTLRGEVQVVQEDGTVTIATPRGPVEVKLPEPLPVRGQRVEITIPAGSPPTEASVRTVPTQTTPASVPTAPYTPPQPGMPAIPMLQEELQNAISLPGRPITTTPAPQQPTTNQPTTPNAAVPQQTPAGQPALPQTQVPTSQVSPQSLLNFLKTSLQTILTAPGTKPANIGDTLGAQRPLQAGQLVRLTPVIGAMPQMQPAATTQPGQIMLGDKALLPVLQQAFAAAKGMVQIPMPQTGMTTPAPIQSSAFFQTPPGLQMQFTGQALVTQAADRILLPMLGFTNPMPAATGTPTPATMPASLNLLSVMKDMAGAPMASAAKPGIATPAMPLPAMQTPMIDARVASMQPTSPGAAAINPGMASLLHGTPTSPVVFAQVAGQTAQGLPVVQLPVFSGDGPPKTVMMTLQFPTRSLSPATWLKLDVLQTSLLAPQNAAFTTMPAGEWEALDELFGILRANPQGHAAAQALQAALPKPGASAFTAPVLLFMAATRGGDVTQWLGDRVTDTVRNIRRADILSRLSSALTSAAAQRDEAAPAGEWKSMTMPMMTDQTLNRVALHYRSFERESDDPQNPDKKTGTRFVLDLALNRIGPMQVDGLSLGRQMDITLRSEQNFSAPMREALRQRYTNALGGIGFSGNLNFAADGAHKGWVDFKDQPDQHATARA